MIRVAYRGSEETVIVVGGNSGIGQAFISLCLTSDIKVISIDIQNDCTVQATDHLTYHTANPLIKSEIEQLVDQIQDSDHNIIGLVNLSGTIRYFNSITDASAEQWDETYDISFKSCLHSCQVFTPLLDKQGGAAIVNMSSGLAFIGQKNYGAYSAAKAAVVSLTKTLAVELGPDVRVNSLAPGAVDTPFIYGSDGKTRFDLKGYRSRVPTGDIATPREIAHVIMYLLSDGASHINGECIHVNGGIS